MKSDALAEDAVSIRRVHARGVSEIALRRQLAEVPIPATRRFVFVRRVTLRTGPDQVGRAMTEALARLNADSLSEVLAFADFPGVAVACARDALTGSLGGGWQWRSLGVPRTAGPGEAIATLLLAYPLQAGAVVAALAAQGLLAPVWKDLSALAAAQVTVAVARAAGLSAPDWPSAQAVGQSGAEVGAIALAEPLLARAAAFWAPVLQPLPPRHEALRTAAVLSLLRWSPMSLRASGDPVWPALVARLAAPDARRESVPPRPDARADPTAAPPHRGADVPATDRVAPAREALLPSEPLATPERRVALTREALAPSEPAAAPVRAQVALPRTSPASIDPAAAIESRPHGDLVATGWGGVLFLVNALQRLDVTGLLAARGAAAPSGWRLLHELGVALGMPEDESLAVFLAAQDLETTVPEDLRAALLAGLEATYAPDGPWPLPLALPGRLFATETHLDFDFATAEVDVAVRLAGLDLDPGWVPWLGRVVAFHYPMLVSRVLSW